MINYEKESEQFNIGDYVAIYVYPAGGRFAIQFRKGFTSSSDAITHLFRVKKLHSECTPKDKSFFIKFLHKINKLLNQPSSMFP